MTRNAVGFGRGESSTGFADFACGEFTANIHQYLHLFGCVQWRIGRGEGFVFIRRQLSVLVIPLTMLSLCLGMPGRSGADWTPGTYMLQALGKMMASVSNASDKLGYGYDDGISLMAAYLGPKEQITFIRPIAKGESYIVAGGGDDDVNDLDIDVFDERGKLIGSDTQDDAGPVVSFVASSSGKIIIRLTLFDAPRGSFCVASVLRKGGWDVAKENLIESASGIVMAANNVNMKVKERVNFQAGSNQWAMYGGIFREGDEISITNVALGTGRRVIVSAGDTTVKDIDLFVSVEGEEAKDVLDDAEPIVDVTATNVSSATIRIQNVKSNGASLILTTILQLD